MMDGETGEGCYECVLFFFPWGGLAAHSDAGATDVRKREGVDERDNYGWGSIM